MALLTFRDSIRRISPPWLQSGVAEKILYAIAVQVDLLVDGLVAGVKSRFPNVYSDESLAVIGKDRRILRGRAEVSEVYASRLRRWLDDHRRRGNPYTMLAQLHAYFAPSNFEIDLVYFSGREFLMGVDGVVVYDDIVWSPDSDTARWARWWLFYHWPVALGDEGTWGTAGDWGDGGVWGTDGLTYADVVSLRSVPREWGNAHSYGVLVLLNGGTELWGYPDGTWGDAGGVWGSPAQIGIG